LLNISNKIHLVVELQNVCSFLNFVIFLFTEEMTLVFHQHKEIIRIKVVIVIFLVVNVEILGKGILQILLHNYYLNQSLNQV
jgi:hypothetical protein